MRNVSGTRVIGLGVMLLVASALSLAAGLAGSRPLIAWVVSIAACVCAVALIVAGVMRRRRGDREDSDV